MTTRRFRAAAFGVALTLVAAACSDSDAGESATEDSAMENMEDGAMEDDAMEGDAMEGMDMADMNMGDASATPAGDIAGAALATGDFVLLDTRPAGYDDVAGSAQLARHIDGTTVTTELSGLLPNTDYISHLHADVCANSGGDHFQFEVGGSEMPPNEIHLAFTSDADGNGFMTAENQQIAGLDAVALVVHPVELIDNKIACVDFLEETEGAAAAVIEAGVGAPAAHDGDDG